MAVGRRRYILAVCFSGTFVTIIFPVACSPQPQTHPVDTAPIPSNARISEEPCSPRGAMMCGAVSILSGETAVERRSACIAYVEPSERRVEQCGALPTSRSCFQNPVKIGSGSMGLGR